MEERTHFRSGNKNISKKMKKAFPITVHCIVQNEEQWIWYAIMSVLPFVTKLLVYDTGSSDRTVQIIKRIKSSKIHFEQKGSVSKKEFTLLRQEMLDRTRTSWFMILDGDEIWPKKALLELLQKIAQEPNKKAVFTGHWACLGDVFHYWQAVERISNTCFRGRELTGWMSARAIRKTKGLRVHGDYGIESFKDTKDISLWDSRDIIFLQNKYFHMTFMLRSSDIRNDRQVPMRKFKRQFRQGTKLAKEVRLPEVFFTTRPNEVPSPWIFLSQGDYLKGLYYRSKNFIERLS